MTADPSSPLQISKSENTVAITLSYAFENYGETPAIILNVESHLFWDKDEPDPFDPKSRAIRETSAFPWLSRDGGMGNSNLVIPGKSNSVIIDQQFNFPRKNNEKVDTWYYFYCKVTYRDIYGEEHATGFYTHPVGRGASGVKHNEYNCWDENCPHGVVP
jgi:hypothetical protein